MSFSDYMENALLNYPFGGTPFTPSGTLYIALSTGIIVDDGLSVIEPSGYSRAGITNDKNNWSTSTTGVVTNTVPITFSTANTDWGLISYFAVYDASGINCGNMYGWGTLTMAKNVYSGDTPTFGSGALRISLD